MKFCYNCGSALSGNEKFCGQCGVRIERDAEQIVVAAECSDISGKEKNCTRHGIIFTNLSNLSSRLNADRMELANHIKRYAGLMTASDICYTLVDASDYKFVSEGAGRKSEHVSLGQWHTWVDYQHILYDIICSEKENGFPESNYLFIIGGHDVVPMPVINHYMKDEPGFGDADIETDLLYSYPYGPHTQSALETQQIYRQEMYFLVGRLPVPVDADISYLMNYLSNAVAVMDGIPVTKVYAQCDPHWKELTAYLMKPYNDMKLLPDRGNISGKYCYGNVMLGPEVTSQYIASVMDRDTDLIFLNLHGSSHPDCCGYSGEYPPKARKFYEIFPTSAMRIPERYNIFVAEACYGGRFIGYDTMHSMIQSGLAHKTVLGLASSRIAFGTSVPPASSADVICANFVAGLLNGYSAGEAMVLARRAFFGENGILSDTAAVTLAEFNLFGDPSLRAGLVAEHEDVLPAVDMKVAPEDFPLGYESKTLMGPSSGTLLEQLRNAVDANIMAISSAIGRELYAKYGLCPREPQTIRRVRYTNGQERLQFTYKEEPEDAVYGVCTLWRVTTFPDGSIESVLTSK